MRLDPGLRDAYSRAGVRLARSLLREEVRTQAFLSERAAERLRASGAARVVPRRAATLPHDRESRGHGQAGGRHV
ncbi:hypothetical protein [Desertihabitans brevis]|uniref:hypothetical protein n=1 Tax=Desertihabitans brevis TaxID=2268447 RepID=UPI0011BFE609|nr:hypothetical protein [Desertihabitans brevis]